MKHTIGYIINAYNDGVRMEYRNIESVPDTGIVWIDGVNSFTSLDDVDVNDYDSPTYIRIDDSGNYTYYRRTLMVDEGVNNFTISVLIDGVEGRTSFIVEEYVMFLTHKVVGSEVFVAVSANKTEIERIGTINIIYSSNDSIKATLFIEQEKCEVGLLLGKCVIDDGHEVTETMVNDTNWEYTFDTLTDQTDIDEQNLTFDVWSIGPHGKYFVKNITQYVQIGTLDDTYRLMDGEWYTRKSKYVEGRFVYYYGKVSVIDGFVYDTQKYDKGLKINAMPDKLSITNYGRVFMSKNSYYVVTICNYDNVKKECTITLRYDDNAF